MAESEEHKNYQELRATIEDEQSKLLKAHESYSEYLAKVHKILQELARGVDHGKASLETWTANTRDQLATLDDKLAAGLGSSGEAQAKVEKLEAAAGAHAEAMQSAESTRVELEQRLSDEVASADSARNRVSNLEAELEKVNGELNAQKAQASDAEDTLKQQLSDAEGASGELAQLQETHAALQGEVDTLRSQAETAEDEKQKAVSSLIETQAERDRILDETKLLVSPAALETVQEEVAKERERAASFEQSIVEERARAEELEKAVGEERARAKALEQTVEEERAKAKQSVLAEQLTAALRDAEDARAELQGLQAGGGTSPTPASEAAATPTAANGTKKLKGTKANGQKRALGEVLVESEIITENQLSEALALQKTNPQQHLGAILIQEGHVAEEVIAEALASQYRVEYVHLSDATVSAEAALIIEERLAQQHTCIPIKADEKTLVLALANPMDLVAIEDVERACGRHVDVVVSTDTEIKAAIEKFYWEPE